MLLVPLSASDNRDPWPHCTVNTYDFPQRGWTKWNRYRCERRTTDCTPDFSLESESGGRKKKKGKDRVWLPVVVQQLAALWLSMIRFHYRSHEQSPLDQAIPRISLRAQRIFRSWRNASNFLFLCLQPWLFHRFSVLLFVNYVKCLVNCGTHFFITRTISENNHFHLCPRKKNLFVFCRLK